MVTIVVFRYFELKLIRTVSLVVLKR